MQSAIMKLKQEDLKKNILFVCGEHVPCVTDYLKSADYSVKELSIARQFYSYNISKDDKDFLLIVTAPGSACVEIVMSEIAMLKERDKDNTETNMILAGSCGASLNYDIGEVYAINESKPGNQGCISFYSQESVEKTYPSQKLLDLSKELNIKQGGSISSDALYGFGLMIKDEKPIFFGPPVKDEPAGFLRFKELYESGEPYLIDMETAFFYDMGSRLNIDCLALKSPSNYIPFDPKNPIEEQKEVDALNNSLEKCLEVLSKL